ncbi:MAG: ribonuclease HI [Candidatus Accumulibacter sp.]|jgi:ribonuclease HI|nr:ribonuclease HI [Accumulibacter sp.]
MSGIIDIYTDGACRKNPGPGGWGVFMEKNGAEKELWGGEPHTTNNRMELTAVIRALEATAGASTVHLHTDSKYVQQGITQWIFNWQRNGWKNAEGKPVKNQDLWLALDRLVKERVIEWIWVRGHSGNSGNERADRLANRGIDEILSAP